MFLLVVQIIKKTIGQLNSAADDFKYMFIDNITNDENKLYEIFSSFNQLNLGRAGNSKDYVFALDEMKKNY